MGLQDAIDSLTQKIDNNFENAKLRHNLPLGYGMWSEEPMLGSGWVAVDGVTELSAEDYPEYWDLLTKIYAGTKTSESIKVCAAADVNSLISGTKDWEKISGQQKIAHYHIIDTTNETFILPRCISSKIMIGDIHNNIVVRGSTENCGVYSITNEGFYFETSVFAQLNKQTRTVTEEETVIDDVTGEETTENVQKTYTYYTISNVGDSENPFTLVTVETSSGLHTKQTEATLIFEFEKTFINTKYEVSLFTSKTFSDTGENGATVLDIGSPYILTNKFDGEDEKTTTSYKVKPYIYDEQVKADLNFTDRFLKVIDNNASVMYLLIVASGYVLPPLVSEYTTSKRLYIKLKK